ncbi:hypothetical protein AF335_17040 [Streptomyces eurocidicus]|uniref:Uncharacterized protein n=1 Tax=Streptomyces eurocidicus TaxID=66423 RepID=A0A2N8NU83_STREU|nr:hypothetical protein AF335_17040 [Streptomyces eurocidicus]
MWSRARLRMRSAGRCSVPASVSSMARVARWVSWVAAMDSHTPAVTWYSALSNQAAQLGRGSPRSVARASAAVPMARADSGRWPRTAWQRASRVHRKARRRPGGSLRVPYVGGLDEFGGVLGVSEVVGLTGEAVQQVPGDSGAGGPGFPVSRTVRTAPARNSASYLLHISAIELPHSGHLHTTRGGTRA